MRRHAFHQYKLVFSSVLISLCMYIRLFNKLFMSLYGFLFLGKFSSGKTTLSASGMLLPCNIFDAEVAERNWGVNGLVVTVASVVEPFLSLQHREKNTSEVEAIAC